MSVDQESIVFCRIRRHVGSAQPVPSAVLPANRSVGGSHVPLLSDDVFMTERRRQQIGLCPFRARTRARYTLVWRICDMHVKRPRDLRDISDLRKKRRTFVRRGMSRRVSGPAALRRAASVSQRRKRFLRVGGLPSPIKQEAKFCLFPDRTRFSHLGDDQRWNDGGVQGNAPRKIIGTLL